MDNYYLFIIASMIFFHILDDFFLQSAWLANGKQKSWWEKNAPDPLYSHDYIMALFAHSFSWAFMILLPIAIALKFQIPLLFIVLLAVNTTVHAIIDDLKANKHRLNLIEDQSLHLIQIGITFWLLKIYII